MMRADQPCCAPARIEKLGGGERSFAANAKALRLEQRADLRLGETLGQFLARNPSHCIIHCKDPLRGYHCEVLS